jgi:Arc/MetJ family transcription regulator
MDRHRTNIELDAVAVETIMRRYGVRTKTEAVDLALRHLAGQPLSAPEALSLRGARLVDDLPTDAVAGGARSDDAA